MTILYTKDNLHSCNNINFKNCKCVHLLKNIKEICNLSFQKKNNAWKNLPIVSDVMSEERILIDARKQHKSNLQISSF